MKAYHSTAVKDWLCRAPAWLLALGAAAFVHFGFSAPTRLYYTASAAGFPFSLLDVMLYSATRAGLLTVLAILLVKLIEPTLPRLTFAAIFAPLLFLIVGFEISAFSPSTLQTGQQLDMAAQNLRIPTEIAVFTALFAAIVLMPSRFRAPAALALLLLVAANAALALASIAQAMSAADRNAQGNTVAMMGPFFRSTEKDVAQIDTYSTTSNVVIILVDTLQSDLAEDIISNDERLKSNLRGFVLHKNSSGLFPFTALSVPAILSGSVYEAPKSLAGYFKAADELRIERTLSREGFQTSFMGLNGRTTYILGAAKAQREAMDRYLALVAFRQLPATIKTWHFMHGVDFLGNNLKIAEGYKIAATTDLHVLGKLKGNAVLTGSSPQFKFFHLWGAHPPLNLDQDCRPVLFSFVRERFKSHTHCILKEVGSFIDDLRAKNILQRSLVFIVADHGTTHLPIQGGQEDPKLVLPHVRSSAHPVVMIKDFGASAPFTTEASPVSLLDVHSTILNAVKGAGSSPRDLRNPATLTDADRPYFYYELAAQTLKPTLPRVETYAIRGDIRDVKSWRLASTVPSATRASVTIAKQTVDAERRLRLEYSAAADTKIMCVLDGHGIYPCPSPFVSDPLSPGRHILTLSAISETDEPYSRVVSEILVD